VRKNFEPQMTIWDIIPDNHISAELKLISDLLDQHPCIRLLAAADLRGSDTKDTGRNGLTVDSIIRAAILKQMMGISYDELAFFISDSVSFQAFARTSGKSPSRSALQHGISAITANTWEMINRAFVRDAHGRGIEKGRVTRTDSTAMESNIHPPSDSSLLQDAVFLIVAHLTALQNQGLPVSFHDHRRFTKSNARKIKYMRKSSKQTAIYRKLLKAAQKSRGYLALALSVHGSNQPQWQANAVELLGMVDRVIEQTQRRVLNGESVPANEKLFSLHEPHTDIIKKGDRQIQYGHKLNLTSGQTGMIIDMVVETGNPCDSIRAVRMVERQIEIYGKPPRQTCFDGGYACMKNLNDIKSLGVKDVAFHKKKGIKQEDMTKSAWVYRKLVNFRAGIEGNISTLKRRYGWYRCNWKGLSHFKAFAWLAVVSYNLTTMARLLS
jgi:transposase, IS5 family